ncbi:hypothetical protein K431DRAFT_302817 [Polychaeton citri CBS 116435]|uniref:WD40 repeat-like protein n=1 Tax=Polychaeton citri CBS 116435 TaxID=1314669 RepID=A0A9P4QCK9_9PEZI|nr:hypothetical protein K431DRAFT_302817 [Polychaeton citri CBS 116435]
MEVRGDRDGSIKRLKDAFDSVVSNSTYAIGDVDGSFFVRSLGALADEPWRRIHTTRGSHAQAVLALSQAHLQYAAIADGAEVLLFDLETNDLPETLQSSGRVVTSLAWSHLQTRILAVGYMDGIVRVMDLDYDGSREQRIMSLGKGPIKSLSFSEAEEDCLAIITRDGLFVWTLSSASERPKAVELMQQNVTDIFVWHPFVASRALTASKDGVITTWDFSQPTHINGHTSKIDPLDDDGIFGPPEGVTEALSPTWRLFFKLEIRQADWMGEHGIIILSKNGRDVSLYDARHAISSSSSIWEYSLSHEIFHFRFAENNEGAVVATNREGKLDRLLFPPHILEMVDWSEYVRSRRSSSIDYGGRRPSVPEIQAHYACIATDSQHVMDPAPIATIRGRRNIRHAPSYFRPSSPGSNLKLSPKSPATIIQMGEFNPSPIQKPLQSSQELLPIKQQEHGSPMPFLSPGVPAHRVNSSDENPLPAISDVLTLDTHSPPSTSLGPTLHPAASIETLPSTRGNDHDSESDDDTFGEVLHSSGTLLPGAVNVPLPRSCGAFFAPNGKLVTFFPPRPKTLAPPVRNPFTNDKSSRHRHISRGEEVFPSFGNLACDHLLSTSDSDPSPIDDRSDRHLKEGMPTFALIPPSFSETPQWQSNSSGFIGATDKVKAIVSLKDVDSLFPSQHRLARGYRFLCNGDSAENVCKHNAGVAREAGLLETADVWSVVGMLLEDNVPLELLEPKNSNTSTVAAVRSIMSLKENGYNFGLADPKVSSALGKCSWNDHTFGGAWLLGKMFEWAIERGDIQMLAMLSTVLAETGSRNTTGTTNAPRVNNFWTQLPSHEPFSVLPVPLIEPDPTSSIRRRLTSNPVFRPTLTPQASTNTSPTKVTLDYPQPSSRNHSQPSTPFLDSASSTPPFQFSMPPRHNTNGSRLSASGSASPEHNRSSFSAAAKYYAQSISDRFASYGSSPPAKKLSISPGNSTATGSNGANELGSSLPTSAPNATGISGSWSKSVSFASTAKESTSASTGARGEIYFRRGTFSEEDSSGDESDRTVEDAESQPQTPRSFTGEIKITLKNERAFGDRVCDGGNSCSERKFLTPELAAKGRSWQMRYAEMLRSWGLDLQAAEMEKVAGLASTGIPTVTAIPENQGSEGGLRVIEDGENTGVICSICSCIVDRLEQLCPHCMHANHLDCLRDFIVGIDGEEGRFECPSGCGCYCGLDIPIAEGEDDEAIEPEEQDIAL